MLVGMLIGLIVILFIINLIIYSEYKKNSDQLIYYQNRTKHFEIKEFTQRVIERNKLIEELDQKKKDDFVQKAAKGVAKGASSRKRKPMLPENPSPKKPEQKPDADFTGSNFAGQTPSNNVAGMSYYPLFMDSETKSPDRTVDPDPPSSPKVSHDHTPSDHGISHGNSHSDSSSSGHHCGGHSSCSSHSCGGSSSCGGSGD